MVRGISFALLIAAAVAETPGPDEADGREVLQGLQEGRLRRNEK